jgi:hypothetical protein
LKEITSEGNYLWRGLPLKEITPYLPLKVMNYSE